MMRPIHFPVIAVLCSLLTALASAQPAPKPEAGQLELTTTKIVVFKDGYALYIKRGTGVADAQGSVYTQSVPDSAILGSFWAGSEKTPVLGMRAEWQDTWTRVDGPARANPMDLPALLGRLQDKPVTLQLRDGSSVAGRLLQVVPIRSEPAAIVQTDDDSARTVLLRQIDSVRANDLDSFTGTAPVFQPAKRLTCDLGPGAAGKPVEITLMWFAPGVRWIPTYRVSGALIDSADMTLSAEVLNEFEDLENVAMDLVVGVPSFRFREVVSPLILEASLRNVLQQAAPQLMSQSMGNAMFSQRAGEGRGSAAPAVDQPGAIDFTLPADLAATGEQDLFLYSVPRFSLKRGGRASLQLWRAGVPLRHLYTLDLHVIRGPNGRTISEPAERDPRRDPSPLRLSTNRFWHQLELSNNTANPWTTGAAMIMRNQLPLGQDLLTYTSPKATALLPVTVAIDLRGTLEESELAREANALNWDGTTFARIRKKGAITVTNYRKDKADIRVTASMGGKVTAVSDDGKTRLGDLTPGDWRDTDVRPNTHSDVTWNLTLDPGQSRQLTYECEFYVR